MFLKRAAFEKLSKGQLRQARACHVREALEPFNFRLPAARLNPAEIEARRKVMGERRTLEHDAVSIKCLQRSRPRTVENQFTEDVRFDESDVALCGKRDNGSLVCIRYAVAQWVMA